MGKKEDDAAYYQRNRERIKARAKAYYEANRETCLAQMKAYNADSQRVAARRTWADANRDKMNVYHSAYVKRNRDRWSAQTAAYRAAKRNAIPLWADMEAIKKVYDDCIQARQVDGQDWHVDHIVPLRSKIVCGLHVENNLAVSLGRDNRVKSNRRWPDMP